MGKFNYVLSGKVVPIVAPRDLESGQGLLMGSLFGIVGNTVKAGESTELYLDEVYRLPKAQGVITWGQPIYWDGVAQGVTTTSGTNRLIGASVQNVPDPLATHVEVRLNGVAIV